MDIQPNIEERDEQPYVAIKTEVKMREVPALLPPLIPEVQVWLDEKGIKPVGDPFFNYVSMNGDLLEAEVGFPVSSKVEGDDRVKPGVFPKASYATVTYKGDYINLPQVNSKLHKWILEKGLTLAGSLTESYPTDPEEEKNPDNWITRIMIPVK